ncbi:ABC transporter substrate-binding protein [Actinomadura kijaniata]
MASVAAVALTLTACGGPGETGAPNPRGLEKPVLNVGVVPVPDSAPLQIAQQRGFFREEGLTVRAKPIKASPEATPMLLNGSMDLALLNYVSTFTAQDKGAISFKLVADSYQGTSNSFALLTGKDSRIATPADLRGKKIAVPAVRSVTDLLLAVRLRTAGLDPARDVTVTPIPLAGMGAALRQGSVDAVAAVEPFVTGVQNEHGARRLADLVTGPTRDFPIAGWGGTARFAERNPKTVAAFQRAIGKALRVAADRDEVVKAIPAYTRIPAETAAAITLGSFPATLDAARLERVAALMREFGYLSRTPDIASMLVAQPR